MRLLPLLLIVMGWHAAASAQTWKPERASELIVAAGPGGGNDVSARVIQRIVQDNRLLAVPFNVMNKPGGGGNIAYAYLNQHAGDAHYLAMSSPTLLTNHILGTSTASYADFTPVARLSDEYMVFVVNVDSQIRSGRDLIALLKKDPSSVKFAFGTSRGNANHIAIGVVARVAGIDARKVTAVIFKATSEAVVAVQGGHVDVVPTTVASVLPQLKAGMVRAIAVTAPARMGDVLAGVPTWKEQGVNAVISSHRSVIGPRGLSAAQLAYWDDVFARMTSTEDWKRDLERNLWMPNYMPSAEARRDLATQYGEMKAILIDLGLAKAASQ
jgi:putative tricarboxylic transport membrane protein